jgi:hypothetical protein
MTNTQQKLWAIQEARRKLSSARTVGEVKRIRAAADALRLAAKSQQADAQVVRLSAELRLLAERKLGKLLAEMSLHGGDRRSIKRAQSEPDGLGELLLFSSPRDAGLVLYKQRSCPMRCWTYALVLAISGVSAVHGQIWTAPPELPGVYHVYGPGGRSWIKESWPLYGCDIDPGQQVRITAIYPWSGYGPHGKAWITAPNYWGGYDTYGLCGQTWTSRPLDGSSSSGYGPDGRTWTSWQTASGVRVTYESSGRTWVTGANAGGTTTYGPNGRTWISRPLIVADQPPAPVSVASVPPPSLPTPEYPLPVPRR